MYLQKVTDQRISGHTLNKIPLQKKPIRKVTIYTTWHPTQVGEIGF